VPEAGLADAARAVLYKHQRETIRESWQVKDKTEQERN
jgi:hypothetical protein